MSRTRLIRPEFFSDSRLSQASDSTRLVYVGLWTLCDDAGYFERDPRQIAAELFRYDTPRKRERRVERALEELLGLGRIRYLECERHGIVPTIPDHRIKGGEQLFTVQKRHERRCSVGLHRTTDNYVSVSVSDSVSDSLGAAPKEKPTSIHDHFAKAGGFAATLPSRKKPA